MIQLKYSRREALEISGLMSIGAMIPSSIFSGIIESKMKKRIIPSSDEQLPIVGLGTWQTFDAGIDSSERIILTQVLQEMHKLGGSVIDSSPMYGT